MAKRFHIDKRAARILADDDGDDDDLLATPETAQWLGISEQWLEQGRSKNYGPKFIRLSSRVIRYRRGTVRAWLKARMHKSTSEYA